MEEKNGNEGERKFLHDISNQLLVAHGMGNYVNKALKEVFDEDSKERQRSEKAMMAINKIIEMVKERREVVQESTDS
ncbi:MAG: hypothetical protein ACJAQY_003310 [Bacteriovoracaceae bacterium]|jgi:uncharacterized protein with von Willebrand factor type A (vWA) domain